MTDIDQARKDLTGAFADTRFNGEVIHPGDDAYDDHRAVWNLVVDRRPAVIARCTGVDDVVAALGLARQHDLEVAVRGGGHSFAGHSTCDDGMVIDLRPMRRVTVDPVQQTAVVQPGLTWGEVQSAAQKHGLAAVGGHVSVVGVGGLTLGGGVGWLARRHGLACDNVLEVEVVTADGSVLTANARQHPDLFWGIRGGGGNFGVVTRFTLQLHPVRTVFAGMVIHPAEHARQVLRFYRDFSSAASDEVNVMAGIGTAPDEEFVPPDLRGRPAVFLAACFVGDVQEGMRVLAPIREYGAPPVDLFAPMPFGELQHLFDAMAAAPTPYFVQASLLGPLDDAAVETLLEHTRTMPTPTTNVLVIPMGGAVAAVDPEATAFWHRNARYNMEICVAWDSPGRNADPYRTWGRALRRAMRPWSVGVEVNHLGDEGPERVREAYGARTYARLAELKGRYDPHNVFSLNQNIEPAG